MFFAHRTLARHAARSLVLASLALATPHALYALVDTPEVQAAIDSHGDFHGFLRDRGFTPGSDFSMERFVAPGVLHAFESRADGPRTYHAVTIDMSREDLIMETEKGQDTLTGRERLDEMSRRLADPNARPLVLLNADFWGDRSVPVGLFVDEGTIWRGPWGVGASGKPRSVFAFDDEGNIFIGIPDWTTEVTNADGTETLPLASVNIVPAQDFPAMAFTWPMGDSAPAAAEGQTAVVLSLPSGEWLPNAPATATVNSVGEMGEIPLSTERVVLHISGEAPGWIEPGSEVLLSARLAQLPGRVTGVVGGGPMLVQDGEVVAATAPEREAVGADFVTARHPRSAIGIKSDGNTLVAGVVDGRQGGLSIGIDLPDLGEWMLEQGCVVAMNLDGGGSSTLAVRDEIVNFPSDPGGARSVSNAIVIRRTAPLGEPAYMGVLPRNAIAPIGGTIALDALLFDSDFEPLDRMQTATIEIDWTQEDALPGGGAVTTEGVVILGEQRPGDKVPVRARAVVRDTRLTEEERGRRRVVAEGATTVEVAAVDRLEPRPASILLAEGETLLLDVAAFTPDGRRFPAARGAFRVTSSPFIDWSEATGLVSAFAKGTGLIEVGFGTRTVRIPVAVDEFDKRLIYSFDALPPGDMTQWLGLTRANPEESGIALDTEDFREGFGSWQWSYGMASGGISKIALPLNLSIPGNPLALGVWIRGDGNGQWLRATIVDTYGARTTLNFTEEQTGIDFGDEWRFLRTSIQQAAPTGSTGNPFTPPYRLDEIYIVQPREDRKRDGTIGIDGLKALYLPSLE